MSTVILDALSFTPSDVPIPLRAASELAWTVRANRHGGLLLRR